jgi:hypothetical protein
MIRRPATARSLTYAEYHAAAESAGCRAISAMCFRPSQGEAAFSYDTTIHDLMSAAPYSVRSANESRTAFTDFSDANARPLLFADMVASDQLRGTVLEECSRDCAESLSNAHLVVVTCTGCDRSIVVDGVHRLTRLLAEKSSTAALHVLELQGSRWPVNTPDFNLVCSCTRS